MRTFFIFNIKDEFLKLTMESPFNLYKSLEHIYLLNKKDSFMAFKMFESLVDPVNIRKTNSILFDNNKKNDKYMKYINKHMINDYYFDEETILLVKNTHLLMKTTSNNPRFLKDLKGFNNMFVCDFENKDYFWLKNISYNSLVY